MTPPDIDGLPTPDDPPLVYRVLEELPDGRVRYESCDGVQTGTQVGMYVVRDGNARRGVLRCDECGHLFGHAGVAIDPLAERLPAGFVAAYCVNAAHAMQVADEFSRVGRDAAIDWHAEQTCRIHRGLPVQSFREWQEERAS